MNTGFGPESANPRSRRAYAHALRDLALISGQPGDKLAALEAANAASNTNKGRSPEGASLGRQTLSAFFRQMCAEYCPPDSVSEATAGSVSCGRETLVGVDPEGVRRFQAVKEALDHAAGVTIEPDNSVISLDYSAPGTCYAYYGAEAALALETAAALSS